MGKQSIDELRSPAADIDNRSRDRHPRGMDQFERNSGGLLKPANFALALGLVDILLMGMTLSAAHSLSPSQYPA